MSGLIRWPIQETVRLLCGRCPAWWESEPYQVQGWQSVTQAAAPAFTAGWRVFVGKRTQHTYCPACTPSAPMCQVYPAVTR